MDPTAIALISMGTSFVTALATKGKVGGPLQTLDDCWELVFGNFHLFVEKKRALREQNLSDYKNRIATNIQSIPPENLQEPPLNIIGPALEASKFFIESAVIREMFAKVIASSTDCQKANQTHSCYVEIIKQLSPLDAQNIAVLKESQEPLVEYRLENKNGQSVISQTNVFLSNEENQNIKENAISISNLIRLGLASISFHECFSDPKKYDKFHKTEEYKLMLKSVSLVKKIHEESDVDSFPTIKPQTVKHFVATEYSPKIKEGRIELSPLGESFAQICC